MRSKSLLEGTESNPDLVSRLMNKTPPVKSIFKINSPCRAQIEMVFNSLDDRLPDDHKARKVWEFVESMNTDPCYQKIKSMYGLAGRRATDPQVFFGLWLLALTDGIYSARRIAELCKEHDAYRWLAGGTGVNRNNISDFRTCDPSCFHELLTNSIALMVKAKVLDEEDFGQDGTRVKAAAGFATYRKKATLEQLLASAEEYVNEVKAIDPTTLDKRKLAAKKRGASERRERITDAIAELVKHKDSLVKSSKRRRKALPDEETLEKTRSSYTDPEARKMKMGDGGYRMAYNVQFATGTNSRVIYGVETVNTLDTGTVGPMINQVRSRLNKVGLPTIKNMIGDSAYSNKSDLEEVAMFFSEVTITAPAKTNLACDPKKAKKDDSAPVAKWRKRLDTEEFKELYAKRPGACEFSNMTTKSYGMREFLVRGLAKVRSMAILNAITHNMVRFWDLTKVKLI